MMSAPAAVWMQKGQTYCRLVVACASQQRRTQPHEQQMCAMVVAGLVAQRLLPMPLENAGDAVAVADAVECFQCHRVVGVPDDVADGCRLARVLLESLSHLWKEGIDIRASPTRSPMCRKSMTDLPELVALVTVGTTARLQAISEGRQLLQTTNFRAVALCLAAPRPLVFGMDDGALVCSLHVLFVLRLHPGNRELVDLEAVAVALLETHFVSRELTLKVAYTAQTNLPEDNLLRLVENVSDVAKYDTSEACF